jgi:ATP phosphoribosyltransferase regulatory subunit
VRLARAVNVPSSLEHPLPAGMRDLLPEEARSRRAIARRALQSFSLFGYEMVTPPAFEFADVLERGLGTLDPADVLRFVEPESGEVAALRPDMTPQIARMIATRLRDRPPPFRLSYEGTVLRRRSGRARKSRQIPQVGVELAGLGDVAGDLEVLEVACSALAAAGLPRFTVDLGNSEIVRALVGDHAPPALMHALAMKDEAGIAEAAAGTAVMADVLTRLARLAGGRDALAEARGIVRGTPAEAPVLRLVRLFDAAAARGLPGELSVDLAEVRGFAYYTGMIFHLFAPGPGEAIGAGGRYDELLARFGAPMPAVGFALDLDNLAWALRAAGAPEHEEERVVVVGPADDPRLLELRARGVAAVAAPTREEAETYRARWSYSSVLAGEEG